jgi:hypothetical protein
VTATVDHDPVAEHVAELHRVLRGPQKARLDLVREVREGLEDAVDAYRRAGFDARDAAHRAVRDFGEVRDVVGLYQEELTAGQGRRTARLLAIGVPALVLGWDLLWASPLAAAPPGPPAIMVLARVQDVASVLVAGTAAIVLLAARRTRSSRRTATAAVATALATIVVCGGVAVAMLAVHGSAAWERITSQPAGAVAYLASVAMLVLTNRSALRTLRTLRRPADPAFDT